MTQRDDLIATGVGRFSKERFSALLNVRNIALRTLRDLLEAKGYSEVSVSSLVNIAGSCENPNASFTLSYYGTEAHLSQSAQLQLEALVVRLRRAVFTVNNSFRAETYSDPDGTGRRLSEFTLVEPERPYERLSPERALDDILSTCESIVKGVVEKALRQNEHDLVLLGADVGYLHRVVSNPFKRITYDQALDILREREHTEYRFGQDLCARDERVLLAEFIGTPTFVTGFPADIKFFNIKRCGDGLRTYSVDLLMPPLGETAGGAVREEDPGKIKSSLMQSAIARYVSARGGDVMAEFREYFELFEDEQPPLRGGFGLGFERFVGFLLNSADILETVTFRAMQPRTA